MAITKTRIHSTVNKTGFKITATAAADTVTLALKTAITITATGALTYSATNGTITRTTGSWITDGVTIGSVLVIATSASNNGTFIVKDVSATIITIESNTSSARNYLVNETDTTPTSVFTGSYKSDFLHYGQVMSTPAVNIAEMSYSCNAAGQITITRNSVVTHNLFGADHAFHAPSNEQNTFDIVITFVTTVGGTLVIEFSKVDGFSAINPKGLPY